MRSTVNSGVGAYTYITDNSCNVGQYIDEMANVSMYQCNTGYSTKKGIKYLKCVVESCPGRATVKNGVIHTTGEHVHSTRVSFAELESSMYKRRRLNQPALPTTVDD